MTMSWFAPWSSDSWRPLDPLQAAASWLDRAGAPRRPLGRVPFPAVNVYESTEGYVLVAELPGVALDDLELSSEGRRLTLRGERRIEYAEDVSIHRRERRAGQFRRTFELPEDAATEKAEAVYRNGVLMLKIPRSEQAKPRSISVARG